MRRIDRIAAVALVVAVASVGNIEAFDLQVVAEETRHTAAAVVLAVVPVVVELPAGLVAGQEAVGQEAAPLAAAGFGPPVDPYFGPVLRYSAYFQLDLYPSFFD